MIGNFFFVKYNCTDIAALSWCLGWRIAAAAARSALLAAAKDNSTDDGMRFTNLACDNKKFYNYLILLLQPNSEPTC